VTETVMVFHRNGSSGLLVRQQSKPVRRKLKMTSHQQQHSTNNTFFLKLGDRKNENVSRLELVEEFLVFPTAEFGRMSEPPGPVSFVVIY